MSKTLKVGKIVNTHGLNGMVKIYPYTNDLSDFETFNTLFLDEDLSLGLDIKLVKYQKNMVLLTFKGYTHINDVLPLKNKDVFVKKEQQNQQLQEGEYFMDDLMGLKVKEHNGRSLGVIVDFREAKSQKILEVKDGKRIWYLPFVEAFIEDVNLEDACMTVQLIEGLYDED